MYDSKPPRVFISYSHDSAEHKKWVGEFASLLVKKGIDVFLDQWDLSFGDDVAKFMEHGLSEADRVLMVCTEPYVRKADGGEGGAGYEAMIVTAELVEDLGSSKFIPVVRQPEGQALRPRCVGTRFYVDLSNDEAFDEQFDQLLRELHQEPALKKPPLGRNPFARQPSGSETPVVVAAELPELPEADADLARFYAAAMECTRSGDFVAWRRLVRNAKRPLPLRLKAWREKYENACPRDPEAFSAFATEGLNAFAPLIAIAIAAVESGRDRFANQQSVLDEIIDPKGWQSGGPVPIVMLPQAGVFVFQALHGAIAVQTGQIGVAVRLVLTPIRGRYGGEPLPLFNNPRLVGWPESISGNCKIAWDFLLSLEDRWPWLAEPFGDVEEYQAAVSAYYMALNILELADTISKGNAKMLESNGRHLGIPACFGYADERVASRAYRLLVADPHQTATIWRSLGVSRQQMAEAWEMWMKCTGAFGFEVYKMLAFRHALPHVNLFRDLPNLDT